MDGEDDQGERMAREVIGDHLIRPRVHDLLDDPGTRLTVLRGAHGTGKTTALRDWVRDRNVDATWVRLRPSTPGSPEPVHQLLRQLGAPVSEADERESESQATDAWIALAHVLSQAPPGRVLIIDDAGSLAADDAHHLVHAVAQAASIRLVVAVDRLTFFESPTVSLHVERSVIGPDTLLFDAEEVERFLLLDPGQGADVHRMTGGLPVAVRAVREVERQAHRADVSESAMDAVDSYLRVRFAHSARPDGFLAGLARMSVADVVDPRSALALSGDPKAQAILEEAAALGLGTWSSSELFTLTPIVRSFLQRELGRSFSPEAPELRRTAAREALRRDEPREALHIAVAAGDLELAGHVVLVGWHGLLERHGQDVVALLSPLPLSRLKEQPLVVMLLAICYLARRVRRLRGLQLLRAAIAAADSPRSGISPVERIYIWTSQSAAYRLIGRTRSAGIVAVRALRLLTSIPESEWEPYAEAIPLVCTQLGLSLHYAGHRPQALEAFRFASSLASARNSPNGFHSIALLAGIHALDGDMPESDHYVALIRAGQWESGALDGYRGTFYRVAEALLALESGDADAALAHVSAFGPHLDTSEHWIVMATVDALAHLHAQEPEKGLARLESAVATRGREGQRASARQRLSPARALLLAARGDHGRARAVLDEDAPDQPYEAVVATARLSLLEGKPFDALRSLARTDSVAPNSRLRAEAAAITAAATLRTAGPQAASRSLRALTAILGDRNLRTPMSRLPPDDLSALRRHLDDDALSLSPVTSVFPAALPQPRLSRREEVVLRALHSSGSLPELAAELGVSLNTIKTQLRAIYRKLDVGDRAAAIARSHELRLLESAETPTPGLYG